MQLRQPPMFNDRPRTARMSVVHWSPRSPFASIRGISVPGPRLVHSFGDFLGPAIVAKMLEGAELPVLARPREGTVAVGSSLRLARDGDDPVPSGLPAGVRVFDPRSGPWDRVGAIAVGTPVGGSSLHAVVIAESLGIPARLVRSTIEPDSKYQDHFGGLGRSLSSAPPIDSALDEGGAKAPGWDPISLREVLHYDARRTRPEGSQAMSAAPGERSASRIGRPSSRVLESGDLSSSGGAADRRGP